MRKEIRSKKFTSIMALFEEQVKKHPLKIAVVYDTHKYRYKDLSLLVDKLAIKLTQKHDISPGSVVGVILQNSIHVVVACLAIQKINAIYLPIDPKTPEDQVKYISHDSNIDLLITDRISEIRIDSIQTIYCDNEPSGIKNKRKRHSFPEISPDSTSYRIYTSGSTGRPKGVNISYRALAHFQLNWAKTTNFNNESRYIHRINRAFDPSLIELLQWVVTGGSLFIPTGDQSINLLTTLKLIAKKQISHIIFTPTILSSVLSLSKKELQESLQSLRCIIVGGELFAPGLRDHLREVIHKDCKIINAYGPTEVTIACCIHSITVSSEEPEDYVPIGKPLPGVTFMLMNNKGKPAAPGESGELWISGVQLSTGYHNNDEANRSKFIHTKSGQISRFYKSGDICYLDANDQLVFLERSDDQVKIRGHRIELGEIEHHIEVISQVEVCKVLVHESKSGKKRIIAYIKLNTTNTEAHISEQITSYLNTKLKPYMIPNQFIVLNSFPYTRNGKIDLSQLPEPDLKSKQMFMAPLNQIQTLIRSVWSKILDIDPEDISLNDNYFSLGGDSLSVIKMLVEVKKRLNQNSLESDQSLARFMGTPTIIGLSKLMTNNNSVLDNDYQKKLLQELGSDFQSTARLKAVKKTNENLTNPKYILITGAGGFLGRYMVRELLKFTNAKLFCHIRGKDENEARNRLMDSFREAQLDYLIDHPRIIPIHGDLAKPYIGVNKEVYKALAQKIDLIYHAGAFVHHLFDYENLRPINVHATIEMIKLACLSKNKKINFISTIGTLDLPKTVQKMRSNLLSGQSPESGYVLSKWMSERILDFSRKKGIKSQIFRPANITGESNTGFCIPESNNMLLRLKGMLQLNKAYAPKNCYMEMVPVDFVARQIVAISLSNSPSHRKTHINLNNKNTILWLEYLRKVQECGYTIEITEDLKEWRNILKSIGPENAMFPFVELYKSYDEKKASRVVRQKSDQIDLLPGYDYLVRNQMRFLGHSGFLQI